MDNEVKGEGNHYTTEFRQLDPRLGRWFSVDPRAAEQPWQSPYCSMGNNPINLNDPLGDIEGGPEPTPEQLLWVGEYLAIFYPAYLAYYSPAHYRQLFLYARNLYGTSGEPFKKLSDDQMKSYYRNLYGVSGEVIFAASAMVSFFPYYRAVALPNMNEQKNGGKKHDVLVELTPNRSVIKRAKKGKTIRIGRSYVKYSAADMGITVNKADGTEYKMLEISETEKTKLYVEVKTINIGSINQLEKGFSQAISTAKSLKGKKNEYSVLVVDKDAYLALYEEYPDKVKALHTELEANGGKLLLKQNLTKDAKGNLDDMSSWINSCFENQCEKKVESQNNSNQEGNDEISE